MTIRISGTGSFGQIISGSFAKSGISAFKHFSVLAGIVGLAVVFSNTSVKAKAPELPPATVSVVKKTDKVTVHTLLSPGEMMGNTSQIIELPDEVVIVDGQFYAPYGAQLKAYVDKLGKPVTRFYISHSHPDHYFGFGDAFDGVPVYALPEVRKEIETQGPKDFAGWQAKIGPLVPSKISFPTKDVKPGSEVIDGVRFEFERAKDNEAEESLVIKLPDQGVYIAQDLLYDNIHLYVKRPTVGWRNALEKIKAEKGYSLFLPGHGKPGDSKLIDANIAYIDKANAIRKSTQDPATYKAQIKKAYPDYSGDILIDIYLPSIYPAK